MILSRFRREPRGPDTISTLYGMIVAQARLPCFYRDYAVSDTVNGRLDLILLHLALAVDRLMREPALKSLGQGVFDRFCGDMDGNLREMGIADLKVPKEMRKIGEAFYGRSQAYQTGLAAEDDQILVEAVTRNIYGGLPDQLAAARRLAAYMRRAARALATQPAADLARGRIQFPDPVAVV